MYFEGVSVIHLQRSDEHCEDHSCAKVTPIINSTTTLVSRGGCTNGDVNRERKERLCRIQYPSYSGALESETLLFKGQYARHIPQLVRDFDTPPPPTLCQQKVPNQRYNLRPAPRQVHQRSRRPCLKRFERN